MVGPVGFSTPLQSLLGGAGIALAAHELLILNGSVFGISGFVNRAANGNREAVAGVAGLVSGGALVALFNGSAGPAQLPLSVCKAILSGFLVGVGTKLANGCTSGHMVCGLSRLSTRSIVATATFFTTAVLTANVIYSHDDSLPYIADVNWTLSPTSAAILGLQIAVLPALGLLCHLASRPSASRSVSDGPESLEKSDNASDTSSLLPSSSSSTTKNLTLLRLSTSFLTAFQFSLALSLSGLSQAARVLGFLLFPQRYILPRLSSLPTTDSRSHFDPSLFFVAVTAVPLGILLHRFARREGEKRDQAKLGGADNWAIPPSNGKIDTQLVVGSAIFGVGWGMAGICPGPALINFGSSIATLGVGISSSVIWLGAMVAGGYLATF